MDSLQKNKILVGLASPPTLWQTITSTARHHPLSRYFISRIVLDPLSENEVRDTIVKSLYGTGVSYDSEVIDKIYSYTQGHPFEMQVLCYHLFSHQLSRHVAIDTWDKALQSALDDIGTAMFAYWFHQASREEAKVLHILAGTESTLSTKEISDIATGGEIRIAPRNIAKYLQRLVEKGLISKNGRGLYTIQDRMFCAYIRTCSN
jgi:hypothetical protein